MSLVHAPPAGKRQHVDKAGIGFLEFVALSAALTAITALSIDIMLPALPVIGSSLGVSDENSRQLVIVVFTLAFAVGQLFFGPLSDRYGRKPLIQSGLAIFVIASVAATFSGDFTVLLICRALQGIGTAALRIVAVALVRDCFSGEAMGRVLAFSFTVFMIIPIVAPSVGQVIVLVAGWRWIFGLMAITGGILSLWMSIRLKETLELTARIAISPANLWSGFIEICSNRIAAGYTLSATLTMVALFGYVVSVQQLYGELYGLGFWFPLAFAGTAVGMAATAFATPAIVRMFGMRPVIHGGMVLFSAAGLALLALSYFGQPPFYLTFLLISLALIAFGVSQSQAGALAMEPLGHVAGIASSLIGVVTTAGGAIGGGLVGYAYNGTVTPLATAFALGGLMSLAILYWTEKGRLFTR